MFCSIEEHNESYYAPPCEAELREQPGIAEECKFIVFESQLMLLFKQCHVCSLDMELETSTRGTLLVVSGTCPDGHVLDWQYQPTVKGMELVICCCPQLFYSSLVLLNWQFNLAMFNEWYFYRLQKEYLYPVVHTNYVMQQEAVIEYLRGNKLHLSGDGRCDSCQV